MLRLARLRTCAPGAPGGALRFMCSQSGRPCLTLMAQPSCDPRAGRRRLVAMYDASRGSTRGVGRVGVALRNVRVGLGVIPLAGAFGH